MLEKFLTSLINAELRTIFIRQINLSSTANIHSYRVEGEETHVYCHIVVIDNELQLMFEFSEINYSFEKDNLRHEIVKLNENIPK